MCVQNAIIKLPGILIPGTTPTVTCHLERMHERLVDIELSPHLISIYLQHGIMPQAVADELAATIGYIIRHL